MMHKKFSSSIVEEPFHSTGTTYIGVTKDAETAATMAADDVTLIRIHQDRWPKEIHPLKKRIRFVIKEAGARNFLVVINPEGVK